MDFFGIGFKEAFGFRPSRVSGMSSYEQELVDDTLQRLARNFAWHSENEEKVRRLKPAKGDTLENMAKNLRAHTKLLREAAENVKFYKRAFWRAHGLAKDRGYAVYGRYTAYLPEETGNRR
jgi:hypothetical protein